MAKAAATKRSSKATTGRKQHQQGPEPFHVCGAASKIGVKNKRQREWKKKKMTTTPVIMHDSMADPVKNSQQASQPNSIHHLSSICDAAAVVVWPFLSGTATAGAETLAT